MEDTPFDSPYGGASGLLGHFFRYDASFRRYRPSKPILTILCHFVAYVVFRLYLGNQCTDLHGSCTNR